jgi:hypothetical protein
LTLISYSTPSRNRQDGQPPATADDGSGQHLQLREQARRGRRLLPTAAVLLPTAAVLLPTPAMLLPAAQVLL